MRETGEEAEEEIPVPTEWESNTFSTVPRFRSARQILPLPLVPIRYPASSSYARSVLVGSSSIPPRSRPYAKCICVLCKTSDRRWPREPDAHRVINTDVPRYPSLGLLRSSFVCSSSRGLRLDALPARGLAHELHSHRRTFRINAPIANNRPALVYRC